MQSSIEMLAALRHDGKCCISTRPLSTSKEILMVQLDYAPDWEFPYTANVLDESQPRRAIAFVHEDLQEPGRSYILASRVKFAVEWKDGKIIYHPVENLKPIRYAQED